MRAPELGRPVLNAKYQLVLCVAPRGPNVHAHKAVHVHLLAFRAYATLV